LKAEPEEVGAIITTYNSARIHLDAIPENRFQMLILDEAHKLQNLYGVEKTPQVAKQFEKALEDRRVSLCADAHLGIGLGREVEVGATSSLTARSASAMADRADGKRFEAAGAHRKSARIRISDPG
jgi:hypothetical protein